jgi:hypothetical protein
MDKPLIHFKKENTEPQGIILATLHFNPHDCWVGIYWKHVLCDACKRKHFNVWLTILPCLPLHIVFGEV